MFAIGIGSNLGNRILNIKKALNFIELYRFKILKKSVIYQNKAWVPDGILNADIDFFNMAIICEDVQKRSPLKILTILKKIEKDLGRNNKKDYTPRIIDLDLLFYNNLVMQEEELTLPHLGLTERSFVLLPLLQIAGDWIHPIYKKTIAQICQEKKFDNKDFINVIPLLPKIMAIANLTPDSFSGDGYLAKSIDASSSEIWQKFLDGASVIDFGAQSTRPLAPIISSFQEIERLKLIMDSFFIKYNSSPIFPEISIDSFYPEVIQYCIEKYHVDIINDVSGLQNLKMLDFIKNSDRKIVLMHNLGIPSGGKIVDYNENITNILSQWFEEKIEIVLKFGGIKKEQIILDPGIGFGKSIYHSWEIIRNMDKLKKFGIPILCGHSKKSFMKNINVGTLGASLAVANKVDYLRIHDIKLHCETLAAYKFSMV